MYFMVVLALMWTYNLTIGLQAYTLCLLTLLITNI